MMWRAITCTVFAFWVVMFSLLVRATYYPEESRFAQLPPRTVLRMFIDQANNASTLHLYREGLKVGHLFLSAHRAVDYLESGDCSLLVSGLMEKGALQDVEGAVAWRLNLQLLGGERWGGANGQLRIQDSGTVFDFNWPHDQHLPAFTLRKAGEVVADDKLLQTMIPEMPPGAGGDDMVKLKAREGVMQLAGQKRRGYVVEFSVMEQYHIKAFFTEAGELAYAELPGNYRALEPVIHGLIPEETVQE